MGILKIETVNTFNALVKDFRYEEAHDTFYHEELVKHENENAPTVGLQTHRAEMKVFLENISDATAEIMNVIVSDDMSVTEWLYRFKHKQWGDKAFHQLSLQRWKDGKIIHERHHYKTDTW